MDNVAAFMVYAFVIVLVLCVIAFPEIVANWVFNYQSTLFELQYQAAGRVME